MGAEDILEVAPHQHARREAVTLGLYLSIVILALLVGLSADDSVEHQMQLIWGTAIGLSVAHLFAYRMTAVFAAGGKMSEEDWYSILGMTIATVVIAGLATVPYLLIDDPLNANTVAMLLLTGVIGFTAYATAKKAGLTGTRAAGYTVLVLVAAAIVVAIKYALTH